MIWKGNLNSLGFGVIFSTNPVPHLVGERLWEPSLCQPDPEQMPRFSTKARVEGTLGGGN